MCVCVQLCVHSIKDTGLNVGSNDVSVHIKVDPDELSLETHRVSHNTLHASQELNTPQEVKPGN